MREIKFRGKCIYPSNYGEWIYGDFHKVDNECFIFVGKHWLEVDHRTVGEYTGLKGRNGKEIYEGDIVKSEVSTAKIIFDNGAFKFEWLDNRTKRIRGNKEDMFTNTNLIFEVAGNIYENPELVEDN